MYPHRRSSFKPIYYKEDDDYTLPRTNIVIRKRPRINRPQYVPPPIRRQRPTIDFSSSSKYSTTIEDSGFDNDDNNFDIQPIQFNPPPPPPQIPYFTLNSSDFDYSSTSTSRSQSRRQSRMQSPSESYEYSPDYHSSPSEGLSDSYSQYSPSEAALPSLPQIPYEEYYDEQQPFNQYNDDQQEDEGNWMDRLLDLNGETEDSMYEGDINDYQYASHSPTEDEY